VEYPITQVIGPYTGGMTRALKDPAFLAALQDLPARVAQGAHLHTGGRSRIVRIRLPFGSGELDAAVKVFGRHSLAKSLFDRLKGSKARRCWYAAALLGEHGVGTPRPLAWLDRWDGPRLIESYYLSAFEPDLVSFRDELIRIYRTEPVCEHLMNLLQCVADAVRAMHAAGIIHQDLGNQNIMLRRKGPAAWGDVMFIDLNRARYRPGPGLRERARDVSRIRLPSDFLRVFKEMYFNGRPPREFERWEQRYRNGYALHTMTRRFRHPFRRRRALPEEREYPPARDIWIWDERSGQAISTMRKHERIRHQSPLNSWLTLRALAPALRPVHQHYNRLLARAFRDPVSTAGRIGLALEPRPATVEQELRFLEPLGPIPVLLRFYHHQTEADWDFRLDLVRRLHAAGHEIAIALVQDRRAVLQPERWRAFVERVFAGAHKLVRHVEVGHAVNRCKWGIWDFREYAQLLAAAAELHRRYPGPELIGPAVIDFEYHYLVTLLAMLPPDFRFGALSHHLYVDRRGAPENKQGRFAALEKIALARAIAEWAPACGGKLIISEVNWPLRGTGVYSPVNSPYETAGPRADDPSVSEDDYADFMIRYLAIAIGSGLVERVYWWRLAARGFGLIDDTRPDAWRARPAYAMLRQFLAVTAHATFARRLEPAPGIHIFIFRDKANRETALAYAHPTEQLAEMPFAWDKTFDAFGIPAPSKDRRLRLTGRPVYLAGLRRA